uniref:Methyltransferase type 12 n=1 Tax=Solibacter usitatus (strain Ellin6076) TaxID=234267 RepID=Q01PE7_SOLUE
MASPEEVRGFYERYPYPRPVGSLDNYRALWQDPQRRRAEYHLYWPDRPYREEYSILVAGCGTSQAAKYALRSPGARVTGIDVSETSVGCTRELKRRYNLANLEVQRLSVERAGELGKSFDQIVCTGVLHHLADPDAGLRALRGVLKPDGAMQIMVYAPYGRAGIYMIQEFARLLGIRATDEDIPDLIAALRGLPSGHPLESLLRNAPDFRHEASLADALLHPQDRAYSVPQLFDFLKAGGLRFGRWLKQAAYSARCGVLAAIPQANRLAELPPAEQYAAAELFRGTMVRHSMIVHRSDRAVSDSQVGFEGGGWPVYVPVRMPDTVCVEERLPAGAEAVLINQAHSYRDLILPIDAAEKRWFEAVDGHRTIAGIAGEAQLEPARRFFERLWWYDQVVFDRTWAGSRGAP